MSTLKHFTCRISRNDISMDKPFKYFLDTLNGLPYSTIEITDAYGNVGKGEIAHAIDINGELQQGASFFAPYVENALSFKDTVDSVDDVTALMKNARLYIAHNTGLLCGIEQALFSILSQKTGRNITELLGGKQGKEIFIQTAIPYLPDLVNYKIEIEKIITDHKPKHVKFKVGKDSELEISAIDFLRKFAPDVLISVDANQAFDDSKKALQFAFRLHLLGVSWAEQLLHKDDIEGLRLLKSGTPLPLMIDEGLHTPLEAEFFAKEGLVDYFNIKLAKTGGILKALEIIEIAKKHNIPVMLGSMLHGKLGMEYNLGFALSQDFVTHDFFSYFTVNETKGCGYVTSDLRVNHQTLYGVRIASYADRIGMNVIESGEKMVNITKLLPDCVCEYEKYEMQKYTGDDIWVRESVYLKLKRVSYALKATHPSWKLKIVFGFRHPEVQTFYFERRKKLLQEDEKYKHLSEEAIEELADTMTANPEAAGHPTGAAVDLTILHPEGPLDMGTGIADFTDPEKIKMYSPTVTAQQAANRQLLHDLMVAEEFAPFYGEWWHYSYGDKEWAWFYKKPNAFYGTIDFRTV